MLQIDCFCLTLVLCMKVKAFLKTVFDANAVHRTMAVPRFRISVAIFCCQSLEFFLALVSWSGWLVKGVGDKALMCDWTFFSVADLRVLPYSLHVT